jgi:SAM-dependent methyltransferase
MAAAKPIVGAPRNQDCRRTIGVFRDKLAALAPLQGERLLDVGCGEGSFTEAIAANGYREIVGIDVQEHWLEHFRMRVKGDPRYRILNMSASEMTFAAGYFDTVLTVEAIEHIPDLKGAAAEMARVLKPGGDLVLTCPNRWFPFENHGFRWRGREIGCRVPLLPYLPPLHDRLSLARVFTVHRLKHVFGAAGLRLAAVDYVWPTFEHQGNPFQSLLKGMFGVMRLAERSPLRMFGSSVLARFVKPAANQITTGRRDPASRES